MKYGIVINTYRRSDGKTKDYLIRALDSIKNQTYKNFVVFLIGDKYTDETEFYECVSALPPDKIVAINLPFAKEREIYFNDNEKLWCSGGVTARNTGIEVALLSGLSFILNLDHDDYWSPTHLERINEVVSKHPDAAFICTKATHESDGRLFLPQLSPEQTISHFYPIPYSVINSSTCINFKKVNLRYIDVFGTHRYVHPSDAFFWEKLKEYMIDNNLSGYLYDEITCYHEEERTAHGTNKITVTKKSIDILDHISKKMTGSTFHHHYHINYDIRSNFEKPATYVEIGAYSGASACLMLSHEMETNVISIDIGTPIPKEIVFENVSRFRKESNSFKYIEGDSTKEETVSKLLQELGDTQIDILFIDGDHSYNGVIRDFELYSKYVSNGGYIIFDDYLDKEYSPDVKLAVDDIVRTRLNDNFYIVGCIENIFRAKPIELSNSNCFIIQKKPIIHIEYYDGFPKATIFSPTNEEYDVSFFGIDGNEEVFVFRTKIKNGMWTVPSGKKFERWKVYVENQLEFYK